MRIGGSAEVRLNLLHRAPEPSSVRARAAHASHAIARSAVGTSRGTVNVNVEPSPGVLSTVTSPPIMRAELAADREPQARAAVVPIGGRPRPARTPRTAAPAVRVSCRCRCRVTENVTHVPSASAPTAVMRDRAVFGELRRRSTSRLNSTCRTLVTSACIVPMRLVALDHQRVAVLLDQRLGRLPTTSPSSAATSNVSTNSSIRPASIFERSRMSLISAEQMLAGSRGSSGDPAGTSPCPAPSASSCEHLAVADDGVERRAQLVGHAGEELGFLPPGLGERDVRFLEPGERERELARGQPETLVERDLLGLLGIEQRGVIADGCVDDRADTADLETERTATRAESGRM